MTTEATPLFAVLAREIRADGPIGLDRYMALCLGHPLHGYYATRDPFGRSGDFVTAPEISQMFGELIGAWAAAVLSMMAPGERPCLVELGPGRGTLMADALRALRAAGANVDLHLVETSPSLRRIQAERLIDAAPTFHDSVESLPDAPMLVIANEFFDALPARQFVRTGRGWSERRVGLTVEGDALAFGLDPEPDPRLTAEAPEGAVLTLPSQGLTVLRELGRRLVARGGALLVIDYGGDRPGFGDTFQAVAGHRYADPLSRPGEADLTLHVDFGALARAAAAEGMAVHGPVTQRDFLLSLGLAARAERLQVRATPDQARAIETAIHRLTDPDPRGMGALFKVLCTSHPALTPLPALPPPS
ncbi:class I SAM-dependent methyltransferase [Methylobacterium sp. NI91]|nr:MULTISPECIES: SAM-dependent methyltransferase [unclassified Methylobacterium]QIJ75471.1 class I SAM-dependent methyltransferase [Methylobacterium sp. CLZ]QIJ80374.1 class I SAM-dependent methyltransferase [Methylobacterium sp. NI91]